MLPKDCSAKIQLGTWPVHPIFNVMQNLGDIKQEAMYNTFNMGIGMIVALAPEDAESAIKALEAIGEKAYVIGEVKQGQSGVELC